MIGFICFPEEKLNNILAPTSDHNPILFFADNTYHQCRRRRFKFENAWLYEEDVTNVLQARNLSA